MRIHYVNKSNAVTFDAISLGDIFACGKGDELFVKTEPRHSEVLGLHLNAVAIRDGRPCHVLSDAPVKRVLKITVELEE